MQPSALSVSAVNRQVKFLLETQFGHIAVEGEISNLATPASGHIYFTLKDSSAQLKCAMFKSSLARTSFHPKNGDQVVITGKLSLYEGRGDYQMIVSSMTVKGDGALQQQFIELKNKLEGEGLFDINNKKPLPNNIQKVGIITSDTGAAIHDVLTTIRRRWPMMEIFLYPSLVQGKDAALSLNIAFTQASQNMDLDCILLTRGGGSLEDLFCFNDEMLARQIASCDIPVISAVGHEVDFSISDFAADVRAATPTAAAELISKNQQDILQMLEHQNRRLTLSIKQKLQKYTWQISSATRALKKPESIIQQARLRIDDAMQEIGSQVQIKQAELQTHLIDLQHRLALNNPETIISEQQNQLDHLSQLLHIKINQVFRHKQTKHHDQMLTLNALSPLNTLKRGYSIAKSGKTVVTSAKQLKSGDELSTEFEDGSIISIVK
ncbi:exodeoxyribonuclease VII large subunit [Marinicellulosiphila megalodicopiae]|uniref:exodeoxyribonuclease VII large subunit n=1 Tax=Marinicellulosiphila megalodicopiae TaxID=2724896 RepID=UPI003BAE2660